jgi:hypothetical protein
MKCLIWLSNFATHGESLDNCKLTLHYSDAVEEAVTLDISEKDFYTAVLAAGAILTGFSGSFLQFRIQRESNYYRQPVTSYEEQKGRDVYIGLSHFSSAFLLIISAVVLEIIFGFCLPLLALANARLPILSPKIVASGLIAALILLMGYFCAELVHYEILNARLLNDRREWGRQWPVVATTFILALIASISVYSGLG